MGKISKSAKLQLVKEEFQNGLIQKKEYIHSSPFRKLSKSEKRKAKKKLLSNMLTDLTRPSVETVVFENPDALTPGLSIRQPRNQYKRNQEQNAGGIELDLKSARYEIMKFGMSKMSTDQLEDAETKLCIQLGAHPPKKEFINYKLLQATKQQQKKEKEKIEEINKKPKTTANSTRKSKRNSNKKSTKPIMKHGNKSKLSAKNTKK